MDSLGDILKGKRNLDEPPEIAAIKNYVQKTFNSTVSVAVRPNNIVIMSTSAALASTLRLQSVQIQKIAKTTKKLSFRISG